MIRLIFLASFILLVNSNICVGQVLAAADGLDRILPQNKEVGDPKENKHVALFYFLWQGDPSSPTSERHWDLSELYEKHPDMFEDFDSPYWGGGAGKAGKYYFWGQSIYGYYKGDDYWVHLKNIQLLTDAGVDLLVIDATNRMTYPLQADALMRAMNAVRAQGKNPPKIVFYTHTKSGEGMQEIYDNCYKVGAPYRYPENWFYLDGKPLIIGLSKEAKGRDYESFYTFRESQWPNEPEKLNGWPWIEFERPQRIYRNNKGAKEIVNVSASQHPNLDASMGGSAFYGKSGNWGRSYHNNAPGNPKKDVVYGYNIQEQWDFALKQNTPFIFVTGWNEWIAGKWRRTTGNLNHALFVDQASPEYSRDIEPSLTAGLKDHYYMQLVSNIRRYKGIPALPVLSKKKTIHGLDDWKHVFPAYTDYSGDVLHRNHRGAQSEPIVNYVNETGRNDFELLKVARDKEYVYFYAKTTRNITLPAEDNWMTLYLDIDRSHLTGWCGYEYRIVAGEQLQRYTNDKWVEMTKVAHIVSGDEMMITIPNKQLGIAADELNFEFKWSDNMQKNDPLDWYINGDAAPGGRFNYVAIGE